MLEIFQFAVGSHFGVVVAVVAGSSVTSASLSSSLSAGVSPGAEHVDCHRTETILVFLVRKRHITCSMNAEYPRTSEIDCCVCLQ